MNFLKEEQEFLIIHQSKLDLTKGELSDLEETEQSDEKSIDEGFFAPNNEDDEQWLDSGSDGSDKPTFDGYEVESNFSVETWDDTWDDSWDEIIDPILTIPEYTDPWFEFSLFGLDVYIVYESDEKDLEGLSNNYSSEALPYDFDSHFRHQLYNRI
jgi:hypothetical protein